MRNSLGMKSRIHEVHNKLREANLSDAQKLILVTGVFVSCKVASFRNKILSGALFSNCIEEFLTVIDELFKVYGLKRIDEFDFIKNHSIVDAKYLQDLCQSIFQGVLEMNFDGDILNLVYEEMLKYQSTDSKSLGIVLTPHDIVRLMVDVAQPTKDDIVLDLCTGTGSFLCEALKHGVKSVVGCELQSRLHTMAVANMIIRDVGSSKCELYNDDCFSRTFRATKSIINPPFGMKNKDLKELRFVKKQLDSVQNQGLVVAIFPVSCFNSSEMVYKKELTDIATLKLVINLNNKVFYPAAGVKCCIAAFQKGIAHNFGEDKVTFINFEDDGTFVEKHSGRICRDNYEDVYDELLVALKDPDAKIDPCKRVCTLVNLADDWNFSFYHKSDVKLTYNDLNVKFLELEIAMKRLQQRNAKRSLPLPEPRLTKRVRIVDIFDIKRGKTTIKAATHGDFPLVTCTSSNNGIASYTNKAAFTKGCLTLSKNGSVGDCFYQFDDFDASSDVYVLVPNDNNLKHPKVGVYLATLIEKALKGKYDWGYKLNDDRISREHIDIPVTSSGSLDVSYIENVHRENGDA
jgi:type I restriction enzyme M protein